jgi:hypothetical protein
MRKPSCVFVLFSLLAAIAAAACGSSGGSGSTTPGTTTPTATVVSVPSQVTVANVNERTVGSVKMYSSTQLTVSWAASSGTIDHYELVVTDTAAGTSSSITTTATTTTRALTALKAATTYSVKVTACGDASCTNAGSAAAVSGTTSAEYWQLQGSGNSVAGLTKIVSDGNARISATRFGPEAGTNADRLQLYYGPSATNPQALATAFTSQRTDAAVPDSYLSFVSMAGTTGLVSPTTSSTLVKQVATGQGVPLSAAMGAKVRLFFEASGADNKTRILYLDSQDGYIGRDFNAGSSGLCTTVADYSTGGGCAPTVAIGVEGDATLANANIRNARQNKVGYPTLTDWRWSGEVGTFMVLTTESVSACTTVSMNHAYAVWSGVKWDVQYATDGCPKLFKSVQAAFPMHLGGARYKMYYGDPSTTTGRVTTSQLPWLGPKKLIYADGATTATAIVDFEDWEATTAGRNVIFLWPNGDQLDDTAEGYIDDFHFLAPTGSLSLQVMYLAITNSSIAPIGASAILLNP